MCRNKRHSPGSWQLLAIFERDGLTIYEIHRLTQSHEGTHDSGKLQVGSVWNLLDPGFSQKPLFAQPHYSKPHENFPLNFCFLLVVFFLWILYAFLRKGESSHPLPPLHGEPVGHQGNVWNWVTFLACVQTTLQGRELTMTSVSLCLRRLEGPLLPTKPGRSQGMQMY